MSCSDILVEVFQDGFYQRSKFITLQSANIDAHTLSGINKVLKYGGKISSGGGDGREGGGGRLCNTFETTCWFWFLQQYSQMQGSIL
jgi:hypothetical protein